MQPDFRTWYKTYFQLQAEHHIYCIPAVLAAVAVLAAAVVLAGSGTVPAAVAALAVPGTVPAAAAPVPVLPALPAVPSPLLISGHNSGKNLHHHPLVCHNFHKMPFSFSSLVLP